MPENKITLQRFADEDTFLSPKWLGGAEELPLCPWYRTPVVRLRWRRSRMRGEKRPHPNRY